MSNTADPALDFVSKWLQDHGTSGVLDAGILAAIEASHSGGELSREALFAALVNLADRGGDDAAD